MDDPFSRRIDAKPRDLGGFTVGRVLPAIECRAVGPFVFFDHFGPQRFGAGEGMDVRPHPHIGIATVTYLFTGSIIHRDTLGSSQRIVPGDVNWMTAGKGIAHSERTPPDVRLTGGDAHGLQLWVALPREDEETRPAFCHHAGETLPTFDERGVVGRVLIGEALGLRSSVNVFSPMFYLDVQLAPGAVAPLPSGPTERALYVVEGSVSTGAERVPARRMVTLPARTTPTLRAEVATRLVVLGGEPLDGPRRMWWNFVSSRPDRIEQAKDDWRAHRFGEIPGDADERIPLPTYS